MKKYFIISVLIFLYACQPKTVENDGGLRVDLTILNKNASEEEINRAIDILKERIRIIDSKDAVISLSADKKEIQIQLPLVVDSMFPRNYIFQKGTFQISEVFDNEEMYQRLVDLNALLARQKNPFNIPSDSLKQNVSVDQYPLFQILSLSPQRNPEVGYALAKDTALVDSIVANEKYAYLFPGKFTCMWSKSPVGNLYKLYLVKQSNAYNTITSDMILDIKKSKNDESDYVIQLKLKPEYYKILEYMTGYQKSIAVIMDNKVFSAPRGTTKITNGDASLSVLSKREADYWDALFKYGAISLPFEIKKITLVDFSKPLNQVNEPVSDTSMLFAHPK